MTISRPVNIEKGMRAVGMLTVISIVTAHWGLTALLADERKEGLRGRPPLPPESKDFPPRQSIFVPFSISKGMIGKKVNLHVGMRIQERTSMMMIGLVNKKGETIHRERNVEFSDKQMIKLMNMGDVKETGWHWVAFHIPIRKPETVFLEARLTTSAKTDIIEWEVTPPEKEASSAFAIKYSLKVDCTVDCSASPMPGGESIEIQASSTRKGKTPYKAEWDASRVKKPGYYSIEIRAQDVNDDSVVDERTVKRLVKKP